MKHLKNIMLQARRRLPAIGICVAAFLIFGLYYLGVYDISFIKRPAAWENNIDLLYAAFAPDEQLVDAPDAETDASEAETSAPVYDNVIPDKNSQTQSGEAAKPTGMNRYTVLPMSADLAAEGYYTTDKVYDASCTFARLSTSYSLPKNFSFGTKTYDKTVAVTYDDGTEAMTEVQTVTEARPAIELYMGYILFDDVGTLYLVGPDGTMLRQYDDTRYIPAYTRDKEGRPLFYSTYKYTLDYPATFTEPDEEGNSQWITHETLNLEGKKYYYLAANGQTFIESDYNDATDNRGLYFDYPAYYGVPDTSDTRQNLQRYYKATTKVVSKFDPYGRKTTSVTPTALWLFKPKNLADFDPDAETTLYPYTAAWNYSEGYATVRMDTQWVHTDDKDPTKQTTYTSNELYVVNEKGEVMFQARKGFLSDMDWIANEFYCEPLLRDFSDIGSYYFDHGLMRIRRQYYDRYIFTEYDQTLIGSDEDLLIRPNGEEFYIPAGYTMKGYSDGMILLESGGKYGYMDYTGKWVVQPTLTDAEPFVEGVAAIETNGGYGMIDTAGNTVIPARYTYISNISSGLVAAYNESEGWVIYVKMTR